MGPLPAGCGHIHEGLIGRNADGGFRTSPTGAYPAPLCRRFAELLFGAWVARQSAQSFADTPVDGKGSESRSGGEVLEQYTVEGLLVSLPLEVGGYSNVVDLVKEARGPPRSVQADPAGGVYSKTTAERSGPWASRTRTSRSPPC